MPGTQLDTTVLSPALKQKYTQKRFNLLCYPDNPLYALMAKMTDFGGKNQVVTMRTAVPQGRGPTIAIAQAAKTASVYNGFVVTRSFDYSTATITGEAIKAAKGDENALIEGLTKEIDGAIHVLMRSLAIQMYRNGGGARGQISTSTSFTFPGTGGSTITIGPGQTVIQLANISDASNWEPGMFAATSADDGTGGAGLRSTFTMVQITAVDRMNGLLTANAAWNTIPGTVAGDFLFQGAPGLGSDYNQMIKGLAAWVPLQPPATTDNFFGVNRSADTRLYGCRQVGGGAPIEETTTDLLTQISLNGGKTSHLMMHPLDWAQLVKALSTKVAYPRTSVASNDEPDIGFVAVEVYGPKGPVKVVADLNCPKGFGYALQLDTWHLDSLGEAPMILDDDGLIILRSPNADAYDVRCGYYAQVVNEAPIWNGVAQW
jgi:hypothetical protein